jgi:hypothetical protein
VRDPDRGEGVLDVGRRVPELDALRARRRIAAARRPDDVRGAARAGGEQPDDCFGGADARGERDSGSFNGCGIGSERFSYERVASWRQGGSGAI